MSLSFEEARTFWNEASGEELQHLAVSTKARFHKIQEPTYLIMGIINETNVCVARCDYCAFYRLPHHPEAYTLSLEELFERIDRVQNLGATMVAFNGGFHPKRTLQDLARTFERVRERYESRMKFYSMTVAEFMFFCKKDKVPYAEGAALLKHSGVEWIPGGGAEVLVDSFRKRHSPGKFSTEDYYTAQRTILRAGLGSTSTMVIGFDETLDERLEHLFRLRAFQEEAEGALPSFLCWTYKPFHTAFGGQEISSQEYVRFLALARIVLETIPHVRTSVLTQNENALEGLLWGADDFDLPVEDEVTQKAGATISWDFENILNSARNLGFQPQHRLPWKWNS